MALWIKINRDRIEVQHGQARADIQRGGRFTDAAFLIEYRNDRHGVPAGLSP